MAMVFATEANGRKATMKKLIELGVAIDAATCAADKWDGGYNFERDRKIRDALMALPTVDAVPVDDVFALAIALNKEIEVLGLSVRAYHALSRWACRTVGDVYRLLKSGEIKKVRNLGDKSIGEIEDRLCEYLPYLWRTEGR